MCTTHKNDQLCNIYAYIKILISSSYIWILKIYLKYIPATFLSHLTLQFCCITQKNNTNWTYNGSQWQRFHRHHHRKCLCSTGNNSLNGENTNEGQNPWASPQGPLKQSPLNVGCSLIWFHLCGKLFQKAPSQFIKTWDTLTFPSDPRLLWVESQKRSHRLCSGKTELHLIRSPVIVSVLLSSTFLNTRTIPVSPLTPGKKKQVFWQEQAPSVCDKYRLQTFSRRRSEVCSTSTQ